MRARVLREDAVEFWSSTLAALVPAEEVAIVLDVGAGVGRFWPVLEKAWHPKNIIALDRSTAMLEHGHDNRIVTRLVGDLDAVPLADSSVDVSFCSMSLQYSLNPASAVRGLARVVRNGGWLCIRTGTLQSLHSYEFMRFFPTAQQAELRAMPSQDEVESWIDGSGFKISFVQTVITGKPTSRVQSLLSVLSRGFPSLQLIPLDEYVVGVVRYALWLIWAWVRRRPRPHEACMLLVARRLE